MYVFYYNHIYTLYYKIKYLKAIKKNNFKVKTMLTYPELPSGMYVLYKIAHVLGYRMINKLQSNMHIVVSFNDTTFRKNDEVLTSLIKNYNIINYRCNDISKNNVNLIFQKVSGYSLSIDPLKTEGFFVRKSNFNARRDSKVIACPINDIEEGYIYQKIVNNQVDTNLVLDLRVPICKDTIPFVYLLYGSIHDRFGETVLKVEMAEVNEVFSPEEVEKILLFSKEIGLDLGELDILRNRDDGKLYIVDANNTPVGPPKQMSRNQKELALKRLSLTFEKTFGGCQK